MNVVPHTADQSLRMNEYSDRDMYFMPIGEIEQCCAPSPTKRLRRTRSVSFQQQPEINWIQNKTDFLMDQGVQMHELWYVPSELHRIKNECMIILQRIMTKKPVDMECARGLESRTIQGAQKRKQYRKAACTTVMSIQKENAGHNGPPETERIASAYHRYSVSRQEEAHQLGLRDERLAQSLRWKDKVDQASQAYYSHWDACQEAAHKLSHLQQDCSVPPYQKTWIEDQLTRDYEHHAAACDEAAHDWRRLSHKRPSPEQQTIEQSGTAYPEEESVRGRPDCCERSSESYRVVSPEHNWEESCYPVPESGVYHVHKHAPVKPLMGVEMTFHHRGGAFLPTIHHRGGAFLPTIHHRGGAFQPTYRHPPMPAAA
jgi:hypothetical protein